jgi:hypothetical protein
VAQQVAGGRRAVAGRALEADPLDRANLPEPALERFEAGWIVGKRRLGHRLADLVDRAGRKRRLVGVDPDHVHRPVLLRTMAAGQAGKCALR